jgi:hypothetical protein
MSAAAVTVDEGATVTAVVVVQEARAARKRTPRENEKTPNDH